MRSRSFLVLVVVFLICGTLVVQAAGRIRRPKGKGTKKTLALVKGQGPVRGKDQVKGQGPVKGQDLGKSQDPVKAQLPDKGQDPVKAQPAIKRLILLTKPGSCPRILIRCLMVNPPNRCLSDAQCPGVKKCCEGFCGKDCMDPK
ncbi:elafin precursor [Sus scrofa]|uniref:Elafin family member protein n=2 Tax=Sus scrofa TaxID=9823 RepID=Q29127_PIG|nr:elafin precursor [Sus scrofa]BAA08857.1 elafin family member protein [Sus scrofa]